MRTYMHINLNDRTIEKEEMEGEQLARAGRYHIVKTMLDRNLAEVDPLGPDNPLIFSAGPFAGSNFSNANRISVGCKSPLTGGIKESNAGGTVGFQCSFPWASNSTLKTLFCIASTSNPRSFKRADNAIM